MATQSANLRKIIYAGLHSLQGYLLAPKRVVDSYGDWYKYGYMNARLANLAIKALRQLKVPKSGSMLDIGAYDSKLVETLHLNGFRNSHGTDNNPDAPICGSRVFIKFDILSPQEKAVFHVIHFRKLLDHFRGGSFAERNSPSVNDLAKALRRHLHPGGYLMFIDVAKNEEAFIKALRQNGFIQIEIDGTPYHIWQKKPG